MIPEIKTILYATNLGPEAPYVFRYAVSQAQHYQAKIVVLHVIEPLGPFARNLVEQYLSKEKSTEIQEKSKKYVIDQIKSRLSTFCEKETCTLSEGNDLVQNIAVIEGQPADMILKQAKEQSADLIVLGTHRKTRMSPSGLIGSTARQVVNGSTVPVLTIRTPDDKMEEIT